MKAPHRILFTIPNFLTAGSGRVMMNIIERLDRKRFAPAVCVARKGGSLDEEVNRLELPFIEAAFTAPATPYLGLASRCRQAASAFRPYQFDMWHSFNYTDDYTEAMIARFSGARAWMYTKKAMGWGSRAWLIRSHFATRIVADNHDMPRVMFDRLGLRRKVRVIHHGVPTQGYAPSSEARLQLRATLNARSSDVLVGCVAHLVPVKGHPTLVAAAARVPEARLVFAGRPLDVDYVASLHRLVAELHMTDRVHFLGQVNDVPSLLNELDVVTLPTWAKGRMEGCPVALLEAMSCGRACIATDIPGSRDLVESGRTGLLVPPEDVAALADALRHLVDRPEMRLSLGQAARQRVLDHFSIEREVAAHEALYQEILG